MTSANEPTPMPRATLCPYCGHLSRDPKRCDQCRGHFDHLSRQASQNAMGPWYVRDETNPFRPGCSFETIQRLVARGKLLPDSVIRGPSTRQFWTLARRTPGVANLFGICHSCQAKATPDAHACEACGATFDVSDERQTLGLGPVRLLPGHADPASVAHHASGGSQRMPGQGRAIGTIVVLVASLAAVGIGAVAYFQPGPASHADLGALAHDIDAPSAHAEMPDLAVKESRIVTASGSSGPGASAPSARAETTEVEVREPVTAVAEVESEPYVAPRDAGTDSRREALLALRRLP